MKKKILFTTVIALALVCSFCLGAGAGASGLQQKVEALLDAGVTVTRDGVPQEFFDATGKRVYPILYNGSTYLPMRAVCEQMAGFKVDWDQATRTASVATKPAAEGVDLIDTYKAYDKTEKFDQHGYHFQSSDNKTAEVSGFTLTHWVGSYVDHYIGKDTSVVVSFNVLGKYDTVTFKYYSTMDANLQVIGDNDTVLFETDVPGGQVAKEVTVNLLKTNQLSFKFTTLTGDNTSSYVFDAYLN